MKQEHDAFATQHKLRRASYINGPRATTTILGLWGCIFQSDDQFCIRFFKGQIHASSGSAAFWPEIAQSYEVAISEVHGDGVAQVSQIAAI